MVESNCCNCGLPFAMPEYFLELRRKDGRNFYCPNGCVLLYPIGETKESLQQKVNELQTENLELKREKAGLIHNYDQLEAKLSQASLGNFVTDVSAKKEEWWV